MAQCCEKNIQHLEIINPPEDKEFDDLCKKIMVEKTIWFNGQKHPLPEGFHMTFSQKQYDFSQTQVKEITANEMTDENVLLINQASFQSLFGTNQIREQNCYTLPGWLALNRKLNLLITETLRDGQWAQLLDKAADYQCQLNLAVYPEVITPAGIKRIQIEKKNSASEAKKNDKNAWIEPIRQNCSAIIISENPIACSRKLATTLPPNDEAFNSIVVPVTEETTFSDLFYRLKIDLTNKTIEGKKCFLFDALKSGKTIILSGNISKTLYSQCETLFLPQPYLWINHEKMDFPNSKVVLVTQNNTFAHRAANVIEDTLHYPKPENLTFEIKTNTTSADVFEQQRIDAVSEQLDHYPLIFLEGKTSVGKSHFMKYVLPSNNRQLNVYEGFESLHTWINDKKTDTKKILFIDEANMQDAKQLSSLLGIYAEPKGIVLDGQFHPLSEQHKIVFAGNPKDYQFRHLPYFDDYGFPTIRFPELPEVYLRDKVLNAIWNQAFFEEKKLKGINQEEIHNQFLDFYQKALAISPNITARNLQMMLLHFLTYLPLTSCSRLFQSTQTAQAIACYIAYLEIIGQLTQEEKKKFKNTLSHDEKEQIRKMRQTEIQTLNSIKTRMNQDFVVTPCYHHTMVQLKKLMAIRKLKTDTPQLKKFGYQGITIEGMPGVGKTELVKRWLTAFNHVQGKDYFQLNPHNIAKLKTIVNRCVTQGLILLVDEANLVMPLLEAELNPLLQDKQNSSPALMLICTQNPSSYGGRLLESASAKNRHITTSIQPTKEDLKTIIKIKFDLSEDKANTLIEDYLTTQGYAEERGLTPPTPRELFLEASKSPRMSNLKTSTPQSCSIL